jgi:hypothetical protein
VYPRRLTTHSGANLIIHGAGLLNLERLPAQHVTGIVITVAAAAIGGAFEVFSDTSALKALLLICGLLCP